MQLHYFFSTPKRYFIYNYFALVNDITMDISFKTRHLYPDELRRLKNLKTQTERNNNVKIKFYYFVLAGLLGAGCTYIAIFTHDNVWILPIGTLAVLSFGFIIFTPYEIFRRKKKYKGLLQGIQAAIERGTVATCVINAKRIAVAKEYEDEGDLFIIEFDINKVIHLWNYDYSLKKKFPCLDFEIYEDDFFKLFGRQIYPLSNRIKPIIIDRKAKWNYMKKIGAPGHLQTDNIALDAIIEKYNNCI